VFATLFEALSNMSNVNRRGVGSDQLGHGTLENRLSVPLLLDTLLPENGGGRIVMVSAANDRTCVVSDVGDLYTWGATTEKGLSLIRCFTVSVLIPAALIKSESSLSVLRLLYV
jgi:hypothetical protein